MSKLRIFLYSACNVLLTFVIAASPVIDTQVAAVSSIYSDYDLSHYSAESIACSEGSFESDDNLESIYIYMKSRGLTDPQAAGVVGNIYEESGGNPIASQFGPDTEDPSVFGTGVGIGKAWGLIQWDAGGRAIQYAEQAGITSPIHLLKTQLDLIFWHMKEMSPTSARNMLVGYKEIDNVPEATIYFHDKIEGSSDDGVGLEERIDAAEIAMEMYSGVVGPAPGGSDSLCATTGYRGDILETAFLYAWPNKYSRPHYELKPEYKVAIDKAVANGEFVGGQAGHPGVDCGGYVTRVMRDSGADPEYNSAQSNTSAQAKYLASSPKYQEIVPETISDLHPGDIAVRALEWGGGIGHTFIYAGPNDYLDGGDTTTVSASIGISIGGLAPQPGWESPLDRTYKIYRLIDSVTMETS